MYIQRKRWRMDRRTFLRAAGVSLGLPWLEAMGGLSASVTNAGSMASTEIPRRAYFAFIGFFHPDNIPKDTGLNYTLTPTLSPLAPYKNECTVFSGMRSFLGGHGAQTCFLSGMNGHNNGLLLPSVDQQIADFYQGLTRYPSLVLCGTDRSQLSYSLNKTPILGEQDPKAVFERLFLVENAKQLKARENEMARADSVLDLVKDRATVLKKKLGKDDRATLDQYFTSIRDLEQRINIDRAWLDKPKPAVKAKPDDFALDKIPDATYGQDGPGMRKYLQLMFDVIVLALQTDSTRVVSHSPKGEGGPVFKEETNYTKGDWHSLSHAALGEIESPKVFMKIDRVYMGLWAYFLGKLKSVKEGDGTLLDHTMVAWGTTNGGGGAHGRDNLPVILCGGSGLGIKHQGHVIKKDVMIGDVWQTMVSRIAKAGPAGLENMPIPKDFQGGQAKGNIKEVL